MQFLRNMLPTTDNIDVVKYKYGKLCAIHIQSTGCFPYGNNSDSVVVNDSSFFDEVQMKKPSTKNGFLFLKKRKKKRTLALDRSIKR